MFELNFADLLDPNHELMRAAELIDWDQLHEALRFYYSTRGRHGKPIGLMVGLQLLKHHYNCSDERAVEEVHENAYWQCFCGFEHFQRGQIIEATTLVKFRERIVKQVKQVKASFGLRKPFRSFSRVSQKVLLNIKKFYRQQPDKRQQAIKELMSMTSRVVRPGLNRH